MKTKEIIVIDKIEKSAILEQKKHQPSNEVIKENGSFVFRNQQGKEIYKESNPQFHR